MSAASLATERLRQQISTELSRTVSVEARRIADHALDRFGPNTGPILFYGSCLRDELEPSVGVLDIYLLPSSYDGLYSSRIERVLNRLVPPNIYSWRVTSANSMIRAKVAVVSAPRFESDCRFDALNTSTWARFCQPAALLYSPSSECVTSVRDAIVDAVISAARWAALLGPSEGTARAFWTSLFRATYLAELRPEREDRADRVYEAHAERFDEVLRAAWTVTGLDWTEFGGGCLRTSISASVRREAESAWRARHVFGRALNALRLAKGVITFEDPVDYLVWKIARHSGHELRLSPWERQHPLLAAPAVFRRLYKVGAVR